MERERERERVFERRNQKKKEKESDCFFFLLCVLFYDFFIRFLRFAGRNREETSIPSLGFGKERKRNCFSEERESERKAPAHTHPKKTSKTTGPSHQNQTKKSKNRTGTCRSLRGRERVTRGV